jgi:hypothetical protein
MIYLLIQKTRTKRVGIFSVKISSYQVFLSRYLPPSDSIQLDLRSMCIANAAFRLSAAGAILCDGIQDNLNDCEIEKSKWPYQRFFKKSSCDWNRSILHPKNGTCVKIKDKPALARNLSLLVALRDEYGHSEFDEGHKCRAWIRQKYYRENIIKAELEMLQNCLAIIQYLCELH